MDEWAQIAARFAVYMTLSAAFGIPLQALADRSPIRRRWLLAMTVAALVASIVALLTLVAAMSGTTILAIDRETLGMVLLETPLGTAFIVRFAALVVAMAACRRNGRRSTAVAGTASGVALGTVAWTGHGAMQDGAVGTFHLVADIVHMLAGAAWLGAMVVLLAHLSPMRRAAADRLAAHAALHRFALTGSILVATIVATGAINGWMIVGVEGVVTLPSSLYGRLLLAKLALFVAMLALAAHHRWISGPRFGAALRAGRPDSAVRGLRRSIALELAAGIAILGIVAYLGTLSPP